LAWLHAVPKAPEKKQLEREGSRLRQLKNEGREPKMPDITFRYLLEYLLEVGPVEQGAFGPTPLSHQELLAWQMNMRRMLQPWEITMLRRLSAEYVSFSQEAENSMCPAPHSGPLTTADRRAIASSLKRSLASL
jgi:hypothetical protein